MASGRLDFNLDNRVCLKQNPFECGEPVGIVSQRFDQEFATHTVCTGDSSDGVKLLLAYSKISSTALLPCLAEIASISVLIALAV